MESSAQAEEHKVLRQWVTSLAITIVCCAIFFLYFARFFLDVQQKLIETQLRAEVLESRLAVVESNAVWNMRRAFFAPEHAVHAAPPQSVETPASEAPPALATPRRQVAPEQSAPVAAPLKELILNTKNMPEVAPEKALDEAAKNIPAANGQRTDKKNPTARESKQPAKRPQE